VVCVGVCVFVCVGLVCVCVFVWCVCGCDVCLWVVVCVWVSFVCVCVCAAVVEGNWQRNSELIAPRPVHRSPCPTEILRGPARSWKYALPETLHEILQRDDSVNCFIIDSKQLDCNCLLWQDGTVERGKERLFLFDRRLSGHRIRTWHWWEKRSIRLCRDSSQGTSVLQTLA